MDLLKRFLYAIKYRPKVVFNWCGLCGGTGYNGVFNETRVKEYWLCFHCSGTGVTVRVEGITLKKPGLIMGRYLGQW